MIDHYALSSILTSATVFALGLFVFSRKMSAKVNRCFLLLSLSISWWSFGLFEHAISKSADLVLFWGRFLHIGAILIPLFLYNLVLVLVEKEEKRKALLSFFYMLSSFLLIVIGTPLFFKGVVPLHGYEFWVSPGIIYPLHIVLTITMVLLSVLELFFKFRSSKGLAKNQMLYFLLAVVIGYSGGGLNYLLNYGIPISVFSPYINYSILLYVAITAYAIVTARLLDIEVVIKRSVVYSSVAMVLTAVYFIIAYISEMIIIRITGYTGIWAGLPAILVIAVLFQPTKERAQKIVDRIMFRKRYMYQRVISRYSHALTRPTTDLRRFAKLSAYITCKAMNLTGAALMLLNREDGKYELRGASGQARKLTGEILEEQNPLIQEIKKRGKSLPLEDVPKDNKAVLREMQAFNCVLIVPLISESEYFGKPTMLSLLCLGEKLSGEPFSADDISFLVTMADQATIIIEYAIILEELHKSRQKLVQSEKLAALGTMAAGVAHEIKNPLAALKLFTEVIPQKFDDHEYREKFAKLIPSELNRLKRILSDLDDFSKPEKEEKAAQFTVTDVLEKTLQLVGVQLKKGGVKVQKSYKVPGRVFGSPSKMMQVFMNIILNAVHAMEGGGNLTIECSQNGSGVTVSIADTGTGIPADKIKEIFNPFFTTKEFGTGLGLAITRRIIEEHGGTVNVRSEVGRGTTFFIRLPASRL